MYNALYKAYFKQITKDWNCQYKVSAHFGHTLPRNHVYSLDFLFI